MTGGRSSSSQPHSNRNPNIVLIDTKTETSHHLQLLNQDTVQITHDSEIAPFCTHLTEIIDFMLIGLTEVLSMTDTTDFMTSGADATNLDFNAYYQTLLIPLSIYCFMVTVCILSYGYCYISCVIQNINFIFVSA